MKIKLEYKLQDSWIGVFWKRSMVAEEMLLDPYPQLDIWICIIPWFPIHITI